MKDAVSTGIGDRLREARESQGLSLDDAAADLRARVDQLRALEEERFTEFGGDVYAKGFLRSYATELGLDPEPLLDTYRREVSHDHMHAPGFVGGVSAPPKQRSAPPPWLVWVIAAAVIVAGFAFLSTIGSGVAPPTASPDEPIGTPPPSADPDDEPADEDPADTDPDTDPTDEEPEPEPDDAPEPEEDEDEEPEPAEPEGVELLIAFEEASWMRVIIDGTTVLEAVVAEGETRQWRGEEEIEIRYGNPGGVRVEFNGEDLGPQGARGQPVTLRYTPDGVEPV
jgi:cytoskeleton protein RodZ